MSNKVMQAMALAAKAHQGQVDKAGMPYILHPLTVALAQKSEDAFIVGLLHDVVEDSDYTIDDLRAEGFSETILEALELLTHKEGVDYFDYVKEISKNELAKSVKIADLTHNSDLSRFEPYKVTAKDWKRLEKYEKALSYLQWQEAQ